MSMVQIQATFAGFNGNACSLFSAYDTDSAVLVISAEAGYRTERRSCCIVLTNVQGIDRDTFFTDADLMQAISAFHSLKTGVASDGQSARLVFSERAARANPEQAVERDGMDVSGPKYRVSENITNSQAAALATCLYASKCSAIENTLDMADDLLRLMRGEVLTI
ncbi:MAG: hypothetical protein NC211_03660 [Alistipes senegalensis]|nr:hypothetical protein [Oxalobacter formigenes]MCM1280915.1 hypothetical protein [Alistipes senegalensis]